MSSTPAAGGQSYVERPPAPALRGLVSTVWIQQVARGTKPYLQRQIPNGAVELRCTLGSGPQVVGPLTEPLVEVLGPDTTVVGVRFMPGAAPAVTGQPASDLVGLALDAEDLWGRPAVALGEAVDAAASPQESLAVMQRHVFERVRAAEGPDELITGLSRADAAGLLVRARPFGLVRADAARREPGPVVHPVTFAGLASDASWMLRRAGEDHSYWLSG